MINFRYHVVTLVAVFLAMGLGVLFGASFIDQNTVSGLRRAQERLGDRNKALRDQVVAMQRDQEIAQSFASSSRDLLVRGALRDRPIVILGFEPTPDDVMRAVEDVIVKGGGRLEGSLKLSNELALRSQDAREKLSTALDATNANTDALHETLVNQLTGALSSRTPGVIQRLVESGFASTEEPEGAQLVPVGQLASPDSAIVVVPPTGLRELRERVILPLIRALSSQAVVTAVVEPGSKSLPALKPLREDSALKLVTVDGIENPSGQAALALGLQAAFSGSFGHYGTGEGASGLLPDAQLLAGS